ncbi:MAG: MOSC domain-containing protein [Gammaproteobacteria bacterium]|nr:MOSC domain-containing protein [Gammaproteobacteria bacterium]
MPKLIGIAIKRKKRAAMEALESAYISLERGVADDFRGKPSRRQVTVLSQKAWQETVSELGTDLPWTARRANLLIDDLDLEQTAGQVIRIGDVELQITQETDPCERMEEAAPGLLNVLDKHWRGGVCCRVIREGEVRLGDEVLLTDKASK